MAGNGECDMRENPQDWVISSQAPMKVGDGSTTTRSSLKPYIVRLYENGKTCREIQSETGVPARTVSRWLHQVGATVRKPGQRGTHVIMTSQWLFDQYITQNKSAELIAKENATTPKTILNRLREFGIQVRTTNKGRKFDPAIHREHSEWLKGRFVGDKNPNWRGGAVARYIRQRNSPEAREWVIAVKKRDGYRCQHCGASENLEAHHIKRWRINKDLRFELSNGLTLCKTCHTAVHADEIAKGWAKGKGKTGTNARQP